MTAPTAYPDSAHIAALARRRPRARLLEPGSPEAAAAGCDCDIASAAKGWMSTFCPVHGDQADAPKPAIVNAKAHP